MNDFTRLLLALTSPVCNHEIGQRADTLYRKRCWELVEQIHQLDPQDNFIEWPRKDFLSIEMCCYRADPDLLTRDWRLFRQTVQRVKNICSSHHQFDPAFWSEVEVSFYRVYINRLSALFISETWQKDSFSLFVESIYFLQHIHLRFFYHTLKERLSDVEWMIYRTSLRVRTLQCMAELISFYERLARGQIPQITTDVKVRRSAIKDFQRSIQKRCAFAESEMVQFKEDIKMEKDSFDECFQCGMLLARDLGASSGLLTKAGLAIHHFRDRMLALHQRAIICVV